MAGLDSAAPRIRDAREQDLAALLPLNQEARPALGSLDAFGLRKLWQQAAHFWILESRGQPVGFLIALHPEADYRSPNFQWFKQRYRRFVYIDRVAVAPAWQRQGLGVRLYAELAREAAEQGAELLCCEVNVRPANLDSLAFHAQLGFRALGQQDTEGGAKRVALLGKPLR